MSSVCLCLLILVVVLTVTVNANCDGGDVNGCTTVVGWLPYKNTFRPACNKHDVCYACGVKFGLSWNECDRRFLRNMESICKPKGFTKKACLGAAGAYHKSVRTLGWIFWQKNPKYFCSQYWVKRCL